MRALAAAVVLVAAVAAAQTTTSEAPPATAPAPAPAAAAPADPFNRGTPRSAMHGYVDAGEAGDWARAVQYLDLRRVSRSLRDRRGPELARELKTVLDRTLGIDPDALSDDPEGEGGDDGAPAREPLGTIPTATGPVEVALERVPREDGVPIWKVSSATVALVPKLYDEFGYGPWVDRLPPVFVRVRFLGVQLWQWVGFFVVSVGAAAIAWIVGWLVVVAFRPLVRRTAGKVDGRLLLATRGPLRLALGLWLFASGARALRFAVPVQRLIDTIEGAGIIVLWSWLGLRLIDVFNRIIAERLAVRGDYGGLSMLPFGRRTAKVFVVGVGVIAALQGVGFNVTGILAGLGIGGLAVALAAQKTVENLFGGIILVADQPLRVGDLCRFGEQIGTVEDIGMRSTRFRTPERTVVTIPNGALSSMQIENLSRRDRIRLSASITMRPESGPDQVRSVLAELGRRLRLQDKIDPDTVQVRLTQLAKDGPQLDVSAYACTTDVNEFFAIREAAFLSILDVLAAAGSGLAPKAPSTPSAPSAPHAAA